jgi:hypothetical protein
VPKLHPPTEPTAKQQQVFDFVLAYWFAKGFPPTIRAVCEHFRTASPNGVMCHFRALIKKGLLRRVCVNHLGETKVVYAPATPETRVQPNTRGGVLLGTVGGPVAFTAPAWVGWLKEQLAEAGR